VSQGWSNQGWDKSERDFVKKCGHFRGESFWGKKGEWRIGVGELGEDEGIKGKSQPGQKWYFWR